MYININVIKNELVDKRDSLRRLDSILALYGRVVGLHVILVVYGCGS
jgi:hypothetical protein